MREKLIALGIESVGSTPEEFTAPEDRDRSLGAGDPQSGSEDRVIDSRRVFQ
jgi:hypothetical protein